MVVTRQFEVGGAEPAGEFLCFATYLPVRRWRSVIPFLRMSSRVQRQLKKTQGLVRCGLRADFLRKRFWTFSVWANADSVNDFVAAEPHATAVEKFEAWAEPGAAFVEWTSDHGSIDWDEADRRLQHPDMSFNQPIG